jgi:hypothetical protein
VALTPVALFLIAVVSTRLIAPHGPVYWDTFGYLAQALTGDIGGLGLGRPVFVFTSHLVARGWLAIGGSPWNVEPVLRTWWTAGSCLAAPLTWVLARRCRLGPGAALFAGLAVAASPAMAHTGGAVLTDGPAATLFVLACVVALAPARGTAAAEPGGEAPVARGSGAWFVAGALAGLAVGVREQSVFNLPVFALLILAVPPARRWRATLAAGSGFICSVVTPLLLVILTQPGYTSTLQTWIAGMRHDRGLKTFGWRDALIFGGWVLSLGPAAVAAAGVALARRGAIWRPGTVLFALVVPSLLQLAAMSVFLGMAYSPRFLVSELPVAIALPAAMTFASWTGTSVGRRVIVAAMLALPVFVAAPVVAHRAAPLEAVLREWPARLMTIDPGSVIVSGQPCAAIPFVRAVVASDPARTTPVPEWTPVCPGWAWPEDLASRLDAARAAGRPVAIDLRPAAWVGDEQAAARREVERYVERLPATGRADKDIVIWR